MKTYKLFGTLLITSFCMAQNDLSPTGNVGIGITSALAKSTLHIQSSNDAITAFQTTDDSFLYTQWLNKSGVRRTWMGLDNNLGSFNISVENGTDKILFNGGNVGIGTGNPLAKLEVGNGNILVKNLSNTDNNSAIMIAQSISGGTYTDFGTSIRTVVQSAGNNSYGMQFFTKESYLGTQTEKVRISGNGNVGIGTSNPDEKLTVKGKIHTQEVRVDMQGPLVPDYVFANDYKLKPLKEVENYIKENSHLPEIPSAKEIEKNGLMLAEMNMNLLKKVEELTLYAIEQQKNTEQLTKIILEQNKRLEALENINK